MTSADLEDERWTLRAWHADRWLRAAQRCFAAKDIDTARPDLWASDDPSAVVAAEAETGNANLLAFVTDGCLENGEPRRYEDLKRLNDGLRERGRDALVAYLCHLDRVPLPWAPGQFATAARDLSDLLLLDVEAGLPRKGEPHRRGDHGRAELRAPRAAGPGAGLDGHPARSRGCGTASSPPSRPGRHASAGRLYKENWVEWDDLAKARGIEAFRFLDDRLRDAQLTVAVPGGLEWWPDQRPPAHDSLEPLQQAEPSGLLQLTTPREGLSLLGTPETRRAPVLAGRLLQAALQTGGRAEAVAVGRADLPYWLQTAIRLGTRFVRIAAAGVPPAANGFVPHRHHGAEDCVTCCAECGCAHAGSPGRVLLLAGRRQVLRAAGDARADRVHRAVRGRLPGRLPGRLLRPGPAGSGAVAGSRAAAAAAVVARLTAGAPGLVPRPQRRVPAAEALDLRRGGRGQARPEPPR